MPLAINKFPNNEELDRIASLRKFQKLYDGEQLSVLGLHDMIKSQYKNEEDIIYIGSPFPAYISDFYGDFVAGDADKIVFEAGFDDNLDKISPEEKFVDDTLYFNDLRETINEIATEQSELGFYVIYGWLDTDGNYHLDKIPQDQYFPQYDGSVIIATYRKDLEVEPQKTYLLTKQFSVIDNGVLIEHKAWTTDEKGVINGVASLEKLSQLFNKTIEPTELIEGLDTIPIRRIDNSKKGYDYLGRSDYYNIIPQLAEINERSTHISTALLKNLDSKMMLPRSMFNEDGSVKPFEDIAISSKDDPKAEYVINNNPLLADAREHIIAQIRLISLATGVPVFELLKTGSPERVESLRIQMFAAVRKTEGKRAKIKRALKDMFRIGFKLAELEDGYGKDIDIRFESVLPSEDILEAQTESTKVVSGISSKKSAIMRLEGMTPEEADAELKQITDENQIAGIGGF